MLNIALAKGRLGNQTYERLARIGYDCPLFLDENRKLVFESAAAGVRYFLVKPADVAIYVERGVADIGVVGKDILLETEPDIYELLDLKLGKCKVVVAAPAAYHNRSGSTLRVATKYVNITKKYYGHRNRDIEIIRLNGSIELAPILGLADVIVDIVETGSTLRENNLQVLAEIMDISARLITNKASYKFKTMEIDTLINQLKEVGEDD